MKSVDTDADEIALDYDDPRHLGSSRFLIAEAALLDARRWRSWLGLLADLVRRYEAIGGTSPLLARTRAQVDGIAAALGDGWHVELGQKFAAPRIEDAIAFHARRTVSRNLFRLAVLVKP